MRRTVWIFLFGSVLVATACQKTTTNPVDAASRDLAPRVDARLPSDVLSKADVAASPDSYVMGDSSSSSGAPIRADVHNAIDFAASEDTLVADVAVLPALPTCQEFALHQRTCGRIGDGGTDNICAWYSQQVDLWRPEYAASFMSCFVKRDCRFDVDECADQALRQTGSDLVDPRSLDECLSPDASLCSIVWKGLALECMNRYAVCKSEAGAASFSDDICRTLVAIRKEQLPQAATCLSGPCDATAVCLRNLGAFSF